MNTFVPLEKLKKTNLHDFHEVWLTTSETWPQDPETSQRECLWRMDRELTQDVKIDDAYFQNLPRLWLLVDDLHDRAAVNDIEQVLTQRLSEQHLTGEFHPDEKPKMPCGDKKTDLRS
ncbi:MULTISPECIES: hypothetical protein [unclassified Pseudomonas]|uniref:hypothetical protein n=1 Tax=unclassified Pseudomonas TaxID=196821 RepID=UPI00384A4DF5